MQDKIITDRIEGKDAELDRLRIENIRLNGLLAEARACYNENAQYFNHKSIWNKESVVCQYLWRIIKEIGGK